ncbi:MAG: DUF4019 domain-containing protein [Thermoanaerobaculia bacterium]
MGRRVVAVAIAGAALVLGLSILAFGQEEGSAEEAAVAAARDWLTLVDDGKYGESWDESSELLRGAITRDGWERQAGGVRGPFGAVLSRELDSSTPMTEMPGAPDGRYVVIEFVTSFEHKAQAVERVTPRLEDGVWRVAGYYVR